MLREGQYSDSREHVIHFLSVQCHAMHSAEISPTAVYPVGLHILRELALPLRPKIIMLFLGHDDDSTVRNTKSPSPSVIAERGAMCNI